MTEREAWLAVARSIRKHSSAGLEADAVLRVGICHEVDELSRLNKVSGEIYESMRDKLTSAETPTRHKNGYWWPNTAKGCEKRIAWCRAQARKCSKRRAK